MKRLVLVLLVVGAVDDGSDGYRVECGHGVLRRSYQWIEQPHRDG